MTVKIKVSVRALLGRINRQLAKRDKNQVLRKDRSGGISNLGFYILNTQTHAVTAHKINLEELARKLGALEPHEELVEED